MSIQNRIKLANQVVIVVLAVIIIIALGPNLAHAIPTCMWTQEGGGFDLINVDPTKPGVLIREYVPAKSVVTLFPTSNGKVIKNKDGTSPHWGCDNSAGNAGFTDTFDKLKHVTHINTLPLTDIKQRTQFNPAGTLQAAAFDTDGAMFMLGPWLFDNGFETVPLGIPDFSSPTLSELFFGVSMELWAQQNFVMSVDSLASVYEIVNGVVTRRISGNGPTAAQLASSVFFGTDELSPDVLGSWTGVGYTGTAELFGWHELNASTPIPEPGTAILLLIGVLVLWVIRRPKRT